MKWLPIETAPKDGTAVLACRFDYGTRSDLGSHPRAVSFKTFHPNSPGKGAWRNSQGHKENWLTHWAEMPSAPENWR